MSISERIEFDENGNKIIIREIIVHRPYESSIKASRNYYQKNKEILYERYKEKMKDEEFRKKRNETMRTYMQRRREKLKDSSITENSS